MKIGVVNSLEFTVLLSIKGSVSIMVNLLEEVRKMINNACCANMVDEAANQAKLAASKVWII